MFAEVTRDARAVCVLLGGSGHRETRRPQGRRIPVLLRPWSSAEPRETGTAPTEAAVWQG